MPWIPAAIGAAGMIGGSLLGKSDTQPLETDEQTRTRQYLYNLMKAPTPNLPTQQIAGLSSMEQQGLDLAGQYGTSTPQGLSYLNEIAGGSTNPLDLPDYQAIKAEMERSGSQQGNRLLQGLQLRGGTGSSGGGKMVSNYLRDLYGGITNTLAQGAGALRQQKLTANQLINQLGEQSIMNRIDALSKGSIQRDLEQLELQAEYNAQNIKAMWSYQMAGTLGAQILGSTPNYVQTPNAFSQLVGPLGQLASTSMLASAMQPAATPASNVYQYNPQAAYQGGQTG